MFNRIRRSFQLRHIQEHTFLDDHLDSDSLVIDLGFNRGLFSLHVLNLYRCQVLAFEPVSELFDARPTGRGLTVVHGAVGGEEKEILIHKSLGTDASSKFKLTEESLGDETVDGYSLERVFSMITDKEISLVKVDIEGSEIELFGFASDYIIRRSKQYSVEFHDFIDPSMIDDINILFARMKRIGYYRINFSRGNGNVLFVRKDCISIFNYIILNFVIRNVRGLMRIFRRKLSFRAR